MTMPQARTVLCFGDSNTHGTGPMRSLDDGPRLSPEERWPGVMAAALGGAFRVIEEGLPGRTTVHPDPIEGEHKSGLVALPILLESHEPIDLVVVMLGTNDLKARFALSPFDIAAGLERLAGIVLASASGPDGSAPRLLIVAPPPILDTGCLAPIFVGGAAKSEALADEIAKVAFRTGAGFLDARRHIVSSPVDGIHFDAGEHGKLGRAVAAAVSDLLGG